MAKYCRMIQKQEDTAYDHRIHYLERGCDHRRYGWDRIMEIGKARRILCRS